MTDIDIIYKCTKVELGAIMEGLHYRQIAERENLSELALNLRYTLNAKKVSANKLKLDKQRAKIKRAFRKQDTSQPTTSDFAARVEALNKHFQNRD